MPRDATCLRRIHDDELDDELLPPRHHRDERSPASPRHAKVFDRCRGMGWMTCACRGRLRPLQEDEGLEGRGDSTRRADDSNQSSRHGRPLLNDGGPAQAGQASLKSLSRQAPVAPCLPFWMSASPCGLPGEDDVDVSRTIHSSFFLSLVLFTVSTVRRWRPPALGRVAYSLTLWGPEGQ